MYRNKMIQRVDFINPTKNFALTENIDKITWNINQFDHIKENINQQKLNNKTGVTCIAVVGKWICVYQSKVKDDEGTRMTFFDFRVDIESLEMAIFSPKTTDGIKKLQREIDKVFNSNYDNVDLTLAEVYEEIVEENLFVCTDDNIVLAKAKALGALPIIESLREGDKVKVSLVDERIKVENRQIVNAYALIHFGGHGPEKHHENGFTYLKIYDVLNNLDKVDTFSKAIENAGGKFSRAFFMEKFTTDKLN